MEFESVHKTTDRSKGFSFKLSPLGMLWDEILIIPQKGEDTIWAIVNSPETPPDGLLENFGGQAVNRTTTQEISSVIQDEIRKQLGVKGSKHQEQIEKEAKEVAGLILSKTGDFADRYSACWVRFIPAREFLQVSFRTEVYGPEVKSVDELEKKFNQIKVLNADRLKENPHQPNGMLVIVCPKK